MSKKKEIVQILRDNLQLVSLGNQNYSFKLYFDKVAEDIVNKLEQIKRESEMGNTQEAPELKKRIIVCDIDGTLCFVENRLYLIRKKPPDWNAFFLASKDDPPNLAIIELLQLYNKAGYDIHLWSGRGRVALEVTREWLAKYDVPYRVLLMRHEKDFRPDNEIKKGWLSQYPKNLIKLAIDDRNNVVKMFRDSGVITLQVAEGDF